jgi:hypothetical protein
VEVFMPTRKSSRNGRLLHPKPGLFVIPHVPESWKESYDAMCRAMTDASALWSGLPFQQSTPPHPAANGSSLDGPFNAQIRFAESLWQAWFRAPASFWDSTWQTWQLWQTWFQAPVRAWESLANPAPQATKTRAQGAEA